MLVIEGSPRPKCAPLSLPRVRNKLPQDAPKSAEINARIRRPGGTQRCSQNSTGFFGILVLRRFSRICGIGEESPTLSATNSQQRKFRNKRILSAGLERWSTTQAESQGASLLASNSGLMRKIPHRSNGLKGVARRRAGTPTGEGKLSCLTFSQDQPPSSQVCCPQAQR